MEIVELIGRGGMTAEAYKPVDPSQPLDTGWRLPDFVGKVKVVVPESGEVKPIRIEIDPDKKATAPASQPAPILRTLR